MRTQSQLIESTWTHHTNCPALSSLFGQITSIRWPLNFLVRTLYHRRRCSCLVAILYSYPQYFQKSEYIPDPLRLQTFCLGFDSKLQALEGLGLDFKGTPASFGTLLRKTAVIGFQKAEPHI